MAIRSALPVGELFPQIAQQCTAEIKEELTARGITINCDASNSELFEMLFMAFILQRSRDRYVMYKRQAKSSKKNNR